MDLINYEKYLLQNLFLNKEARDKIFPFLDPSYFDGSFSTQNIVKEYISYYNKYKTYPSPRELSNCLTDSESYNDFKEILSHDFSDVSETFLQEHAAEFFRQKMLMNSTLEIVELIKTKGSSAVHEYPDKFRESLSFSFDTHVGLDFCEEKERLFESLKQEDNAISTGLSDLDDLIKGGFHEKTLTLLISPTNTGKSLIKCAVGVNALLQNYNVLYVTLEMSEEKISERILANVFDVDISKLGNLSKESFMAYYDKFLSSVKSKFIVKEFPTRGANTNSIRNLLKELEVKKKFKPDIIFVDYLGIMTTNSKFVDGNTNVVYKIISEELRGLAVETGIPIVSSNQTNRGGMNVSDFEITDVADSIGQTMTADIIIGVTQTEEMNQQGLYSFKILKNRYGGRYNRTLISVDYSKMRLSNGPKESDFIDSDEIEKTAVHATTAINDAMKFNRRAGRDKIIEFE